RRAGRPSPRHRHAGAGAPARRASARARGPRRQRLRARMRVPLPAGVPWKRPSPAALGGSGEPPGHWFAGRGGNQERGPQRFASLQAVLARALALDPEAPLVTQAMAEVALGVTIQIDGAQYTRISDAALAITDQAGETTFLNLETGEQR